MCNWFVFVWLLSGMGTESELELAEGIQMGIKMTWEETWELEWECWRMGMGRNGNLESSSLSPLATTP